MNIRPDSITDILVPQLHYLIFYVIGRYLGGFIIMLLLAAWSMWHTNSQIEPTKWNDTEMYYQWLVKTPEGRAYHTAYNADGSTCDREYKSLRDMAKGHCVDGFTLNAMELAKVKRD